MSKLDRTLSSSTHDAGAGERVKTESGSSAAVLSPEELVSLTHILQKNRRKLPPPSFSLAPLTPLPVWQRVALSTIKRIDYDEEDQRQAATSQVKLGKELVKYHADVHAREEKLRRQQREARAQLGSRLALSTRRLWARRGDVFQQMQRVEFDMLKRHRDKRKQEDLLRETEELTKRLLDSIIADKPKDAEVLQLASKSETTGGTTSEVVADDEAEAEAMNAAFRRSGKDGSVMIESSLALLDTEKGHRPLRHYQRSALHWMIHLFENNLNGILADEMGLGKTVQTIALLCYYAQYKNDWGPHLIVVPTTVVLNWKAELQRWAPGLKVLTYIGSTKERHKLRQGWTAEDAFHICVTSYNLVVQDRLVFRKRAWGFLVLDEAHQVKNFMSKKWQSLFDLQAEYRLLLTGTPLQNSIMELWSLFHFLLPFASAFRSNDEFKEWFSNPMDDMITGRSSLNEDIVRRLQSLIRPFMLRRLKKDVEAQLPTKTEKVVMCHLSRRQRSLYDDYMQLAETKQRLRGGGAGGVLSVLLGLRKVCDHPDLFEERPTVSPLVLDRFGMITVRAPRQILLRDNDYRGRYRFPSLGALDIVDVNAEAEVKSEKQVSEEEESHECGDADCFSWLPCRLTHISIHTGPDAYHLCDRSTSPSSWLRRFDAPQMTPVKEAPPPMSRAFLKTSAERRSCTTEPTGQGYLSAMSALVASAQEATQAIHAAQTHTSRFQTQRREEIGYAIVFPVPRAALCASTFKDAIIKCQHGSLCPTVAERADAILPVVQKAAVYVPAALAAFPPRLHCAFPVRRPQAFTLPSRESLAPLIGFTLQETARRRRGDVWSRDLYDASPFLAELWPMHVRRCFSFPDKRLLIHDCGKLQFLAGALKQLRQEGHRMLIFTQFVHMLNILERFLALVGVAYLRLDGSTRAEARQAMVDRFNEDERVTCMILSTRSGGIGLNLTGADTVIFYDSDWNPTMDLQAQDRCHRIGQTRPVTIYRLISEHTVEEAILEKARERKRLNNVVIRGGQFHAIAGVSDEYEDTAAAFAALSDPVNLRSFFHDFDEDVTLPVDSVEGGSGAATAQDILTEMGNVEDDEDRAARTQLEAELHEREREEAEEQHEDDLDEEERVDGRGAFPVASKEEAPRNAPATSHRAALQLQEARLQRVLSAPEASQRTGPAGSPPNQQGHPELVAAGLMPAVQKRQREILAKTRSPLDRLITCQYGLCREGDAWRRYNKLCDDYEAKLVDEDAPLEGPDEVDLEHVFPPFRVKLEL